MVRVSLFDPRPSILPAKLAGGLILLIRLISIEARRDAVSNKTKALLFMFGGVAVFFLTMTQIIPAAASDNTLNCSPEDFLAPLTIQFLVAWFLGLGTGVYSRQRDF